MSVSVGEALSGAPRWQRDLIAQRAGVSKAHVDTWARTGGPNLAGWIQRTITDILLPRQMQPSPVTAPTAAPSSTPLAVALRRAPFDTVITIADRLGITVSELRRRARADWQPEPWTQRQIAAVLDADATDVFPDHRVTPETSSLGPTKTATRSSRRAYDPGLRALEGLSDG
jgi:hypothetical protein